MNREKRALLEPWAEPLAIIGFAGRWPGAGTSAQLEELLYNGISGKGAVPPTAFNIDAFYSKKKGRPGSVNQSSGYFLPEDPKLFDHGFFGINPTEAKTMDPAQRQLLEICYECFESAGVSLGDLSGSRTGCFVGNHGFEFAGSRYQDTDFSTINPYGATGGVNTLLSNRINYIFNLRGPSLTIDTACSSSMYALHTACNSLHAGDCDAAVVAGVNLMFGPFGQMDAATLGALSPTSTCHTFDADADGYARAEGVGCLYIKRLGDAIRAQDSIRAVVRGTAINTNGKTGGITYPSAAGQEEVIRTAYAKAGIIDFGKTSYCELHGTGTPVGDPLEVAAIGSVFGKTRCAQEPILIGSVKPNLGHSESSSGISSLLKAIFTLETGVIPPTIGIKRLNPAIDFEGNNTLVVTANTPLRTLSGVSRVSVNNIGFGGTNGHAVLESVQSFLQETYTGTGIRNIPAVIQCNSFHRAIPSRSEKKALGRPFLVVFSAQDEVALDRNISAVSQVAAKYALSDLAYTLCARRSLFYNRSFLTLREGEHHSSDSFGSLTSGTPDETPPKITFVFTGQGAQWSGMGVELAATFPVFRNTLRELDKVLQALPESPSWTIEGIFEDVADNLDINTALLAQPLCTALQIALVNLLSSWNIVPTAVVGHSSGETAAAYASGRLHAEEAIIIAYYRGMVADSLHEDGAMLAVALSKEQMSLYLQGANGVVIGCVNSPQSITLSGDKEAIHAMHERLQKESIFSRILKTNGKAYHSHHMLTVGERYEKLLEKAILDKSVRVPTATMISSVTGEEMPSNIPLSYWRSNLESPVLFHSAVLRLVETVPVDRIIEVGPHSALQGPLRQTTKLTDGKPPVYAPTVTRQNDSAISLLNLAGSLFMSGFPVDIVRVNAIETVAEDGNPQVLHSSLITDLPSYQWNHSNTQWEESTASLGYRFRKHQRHDLLGSRLPYGGSVTMSWRNIIRVKDIPWVADHKIQNRTVFPAAGYLCMAMEAALQVIEMDTDTSHLAETVSFTFENISFRSALVLEDKEEYETLLALLPSQTSSSASSKRWLNFTISSAIKGTTTWAENCNGSIQSFVKPQGSQKYLLQLPPNSQRVDAVLAYRRMHEIGLCYGPAFQRLREVSWNNKQKKIFGTVLVVEAMENESRYVIHPTALDAGMQLSTLVLAAGNIDSLVGLLLVFIEKLEVSGVSRSSWPKDATADFAVWAHPHGFRAAKVGFDMSSPENSFRLAAQGVKALKFENTALDGASTSAEERLPYLRVVWKPEINRLTSKQLQDYLHDDSYLTSINEGLPLSTSEQQLLALLDLAVHKNSGMRILHLGRLRTHANLMTLLHDNSRAPRFLMLTFVGRDNSGQASGDRIRKFDTMDAVPEAEKFHLIVLEEHNDLPQVQEAFGRLENGGILFLQRTAAESQILQAVNYQDTPLMTDHYVVLRRVLNEQKRHARKTVTVVYRSDKHNAYAKALESLATSQGWVLSFSSLEEVDVQLDERILSLVDVDDSPLLETITQTEIEGLQRIVSRCSLVMWLTKDGKHGKNPAGAMMSAFARSVMSEEVRLHFMTFDLDDPAQNLVKAFDTLIQPIEDHFFCNDTLAGPTSMREREYGVRDGIICIPRAVPDRVENANFQARFAMSEESTLGPRAIGGAALCLELGHPGQIGSIYFEEDLGAYKPLPTHYVEIEVKAAGVNNKDVMIMLGMFDPVRDDDCGKPYYYSLERAGIVTRVGSDVTDFSPGDRVASLWPGYYSTLERVPAVSCRHVPDGVDFKSMVTILTVYSTAVYAFNYLAHLQKDETVLVHTGAGGVGIAAITLAQAIGAKVYTTVSSTSKKRFLEKKFGLPSDCIFQSRDSSFAEAIMAATSGKGVDVVLSAQTGDLLNDSWKCLAPFGRFIDIGRKEVLDHGKLDMSLFAKNCVFHSFDLSEIASQRITLFSQILDDVISLYKAGTIQPIDPVTVYPVSELADALRYFTRGLHIGKLVISYEDPEATVMCRPTAGDVRLHDDATYLIIGGLGGLGKSLIEWMTERGARKFAVLSRSGTSNLNDEAMAFVKRITDYGGQLISVKGDAMIREDVQRFVDIAASHGTIKGAINSAMIVGNALFSSPDTLASTCRNVVNIKHLATRYLHDALLPHNVDFFIPLSSMSGAAGPLTQSTYAAANAAMDSFARQRHALGLPCISLGLGAISEVGHLHENNDVQDKFRKAGLLPMNRAEFLHALETSIRLQTSPRSNDLERALLADEGASSYLLTGLDMLKMSAIVEKGYEGGSGIHDDPKFTVLANAIRMRASEGSGALEKKGESTLARIGRIFRDHGKDAAAARTIEVFVEKVSNLLLVPKEQFDIGKSVVHYGLDSLVGGELRMWVYRELVVEVSFVELSIPTKSIKQIVERLFERMALK